MPNNNLLTANNNDKCLIEYDHCFNVIKRIDRINGDSFCPYGISLNPENKHLFISDKDNNRIIMTDLEFNKIKAFGSFGVMDDKFNSICGICFQNGYLYVCDNLNKRIVILTKDLEFVQILEVDYMPWTIKSSNSMLAVEAGNYPGLYFYSIKDFVLKHKFDHGFCRISEINSKFYEFDKNSKSVYCYDQKGNLITEVKVSNVLDDTYVTDSWDGSFIFMQGSIIMTCHAKKKMIKFSRV